jgi:hypothetical protein
MKKSLSVVALGMGLTLGSVAALAKLPPAPPKTDAEKAAAAQKAAAAKAHGAKVLAEAEDRAVANWRKNKGMAEPAKPAPMMEKHGKKK